MARHQRRKKQRHWHIDYLTAAADAITPVPIVSSERLECALAQSVGALSKRTLGNFGSTDYHCPGHLFYFAENPLQNHSFINPVHYYRIGRLEQYLAYQVSGLRIAGVVMGLAGLALIIIAFMLAYRRQQV